MAVIKDWKRGDHVQREVDVYDPSKGMMYGTVVFKYGKRSHYFDPELDLGYYPELYAVRWDHKPNEISSGYLRHGLNTEEDIVTRTMKQGVTIKIAA